ncbi:DUF4236 domain-containing protein [Blastopirellula sp. JC732]|uniref:DUF4236 domain-containing protein n=1 Tax=Blastopirellula sediminis TaxID=2894196 RepID=A0A9X1MS56_9BACT|nr:DUF4236 domain-containing protein [Blastopirellula sediminis]MCC9604929.1 DUF4236 domain-containing protein [Blastopirellula sediminis]MCC9631771.1 DUF4236 domain-containing protein [Blastopirellula sediminis]
MGWTARKSITLGPLRINFSKSGVGFSFGITGFRGGMSATGRKYVSATIPGTGIRYQKSGKTLMSLLDFSQPEKKTKKRTYKRKTTIR